ncbi:MAG TPA: hypothetical protein PLH43_01800 [Acetivibrio sp.]|mgnify:CR=1 FL=1|uniref:hypothetical protein n=1 Tax=Acetivibrio sp. TaxID=1872092 RepID=UPI002C94DB25|nr:hypothetical protein [Acetivibrio sp.]HOM01548.1 hypothetical protein [Acetivibrio sp.]
MPRFKTDIVLNKPEDFVNFIIKDFMNKEGFKYTVYKGENVWQHGNGWLTSPQFIKTTYINGTLTIEAWLKFAWLPGVYSGEMDLDGFVGALIKNMLRDKVNNLINLLKQPLPNETTKNFNEFEIGGSGNYQNIPRNGPILVKTHDTSGNAKFSLIFGLISLIGFLFPVFGIIFGTLSIAYAGRGINSSKNGMAIAGMVISIFMIIISILLLILNIIIKINRIIS